MRRIVLYNSDTGFTKKYANWISQKLECECESIKKLKSIDITSYDMVIFGGWIMGNMIMGLDKVRNSKPKELTIFAVGATPWSIKVENLIKEQNKIVDSQFYYFEGGFAFENLSFIKRIMLNLVKKSIAKKENKTDQDIFMEQILGTSFDHTKEQYIETLLHDIG